MIVIGLTGSIGQGKSTVAKQFTKYGASVCDSDKIVHKLLSSKGAAVEKIEALFPGVKKGNFIDRQLLGRAVFGDNEKLKLLEDLKSGFEEMNRHSKGKL